MDTFNDIRRWLSEMRGNFPSIAHAAGVSTKTLGRIVNDPGYSVNLRTLEKLQEVRRNAKQPRARARA